VEQGYNDGLCMSDFTDTDRCMPKLLAAYLRKTQWCFGMAALVLSAGCDGGSKTADDGYQSARQVCGGLSDASARTLETIAGTEKFSSSPERGDFQLPATTSEELDGSAVPKQHELCSIKPESVRNEQHIGIYFKVTRTLPAAPDKRLRGNYYFKAGLRAEASDLGAQLYFRCARENSASTKAQIIKADFRYSPASRGKVPYEGNMQLLNEASYRLAQQLSCLQSSGLTRQLSLE
jgi:hypothetical protein